MVTVTHTDSLKNTTHKVVVPFYAYAAISLLTATLLLFFSTDAFTAHYFNPPTLAITHIMALGWGTMIILGAGHQLIPVLVSSDLYSTRLAHISFWLAALGIPLLVYGFFQFRFDALTEAGAILVNGAIVSYVVNLGMSISRAKKENVHAIFMFTASTWLLITTLIGLLLVWNFTRSLLPEDSLHYLGLHAHIGIVGWFLLMVMGVGSRLIPMFLISKYESPKTLWWIYGLLNGGLVLFIVIFFMGKAAGYYLLPVLLIVTALKLFAGYCYKAYKARIRKKVDEQMKISLGSVIMMLLPVIIIVAFLLFMILTGAENKLVLSYGFSIFFGWLTAIILGMTFKTLPFIIWNKVFHEQKGIGKTPNPKDLFSEKIFHYMTMAYLLGFILFLPGVLLANTLLLQAGTVLLLTAAVLYNWNVLKMLVFKPKNYVRSNN